MLQPSKRRLRHGGYGLLAYFSPTHASWDKLERPARTHFIKSHTSDLKLLGRDLLGGGQISTHYFTASGAGHHWRQVLEYIDPGAVPV